MDDTNQLACDEPAARLWLRFVPACALWCCMAVDHLRLVQLPDHFPTAEPKNSCEVPPYCLVRLGAFASMRYNHILLLCDPPQPRCFTYPPRPFALPTPDLVASANAGPNVAAPTNPGFNPGRCVR